MAAVSSSPIPLTKCNSFARPNLAKHSAAFLVDPPSEIVILPIWSCSGINVSVEL